MTGTIKKLIYSALIWYISNQLAGINGKDIRETHRPYAPDADTHSLTLSVNDISGLYFKSYVQRKGFLNKVRKVFPTFSPVRSGKSGL